MKMTAYEMLARYDKEDDKEKVIDVLADFNGLTKTIVHFIIDNRGRFEESEELLSPEMFARWCEKEMDRVDDEICEREKYYKEVTTMYRIASTFRKGAR